MNNQCLVLLVSYFSLAVEKLFKDSLILMLNSASSGTLKLEPLKLTLDELKECDFDLKASIGDIVAKDISFQDMQSIGRAFNTFYCFMMPQDKDVNNIILAQACRHAIVHIGAVVSQRTQRQVAKAVPRELKLTLGIDSEIGFDRNEVRLVGQSMDTYLSALAFQIEKAVAGQKYGEDNESEPC